MSDLISRKALLNHLSSWQMEQFAEVGHEKEYNLLDMIIRGVENEPTVEQPKGEWKTELGLMFVEYRCSECNYATAIGKTNFCPNCGARMKGK